MTAGTCFGGNAKNLTYPRWLARFKAWRGGYFWLPCPICLEKFAGFEIGDYGIRLLNGSGKSVCAKPSCQEEAKCREHEWYASRGECLIALHPGGIIEVEVLSTTHA